RGVDPAFQFYRTVHRSCALLAGAGDEDLPFEQLVFGAATVEHGQFAWRQQDNIAVFAIDLLLEKEIRGESFALWRIDGALFVLEGETANRRFAVEIRDAQPHRDGGLDIEQNRHFAAEALVLRSLADVEAQRGFAFSAFAAGDQRNRVFAFQPAQVVGHRLFLENFDIQKVTLVRLGV